MENQIFYTVNVLLHCNFATMFAVKIIISFLVYEIKIYDMFRYSEKPPECDTCLDSQNHATVTAPAFNALCVKAQGSYRDGLL